jgi:hypothetical protein
MRILVLPGGSSSCSSEKYRKSYCDIVSGLRNANPSADVDLLTYPGQVKDDGSGMGELTIGNAADRVLKPLVTGDQSDVRLMCICFGCIVGANVLRKAEAVIARVCFYAPLPYWKLGAYEFLSESSWTNGTRGEIATQFIITGGTPFEDFFNGQSAAQAKVAIGGEDTVVIPATLDYFRTLLAKRAGCEFALVANAPHTVSEKMAGWTHFSRECLDWVAATESQEN